MLTLYVVPDEDGSCSVVDVGSVVDVDVVGLSLDG
jgi:hypothetical protein